MLAGSPENFGATLAGASETSDDGWRKRLRTLPAWVALEAEGSLTLDSALGTATYCPPDSDGPYPMLISMYVRPAARGRGVGEVLIEAVVDHARAQGHVRLVLDVRESNIAGRRLYARAGFRAADASLGVPEDGCEVRMSRELRADVDLP